MKILITNTVVLNGGDAAILLAEMDLLKSVFGEDTKFVVYDSRSEIASRYYPELTFRRSLYSRVMEGAPKRVYLQIAVKFFRLFRFWSGAWLWKNGFRLPTRFLLTTEDVEDLSEYLAASLVVSTGGTYLVENYDLTPRIFDFEICMLMDRPLVFFTQSLGPFSSFSNRRRLKRIFDHSLLVLLRDQFSQRNLLDLGIRRSRVYVSADAVFAIADPAAIEASGNVVSDSLSGIRVAISVRYWNHFKTVPGTVGMTKYIKAMQDLSAYIINKYEASITYVSTCQGISEYWADDSRIAAEIVEALPDNIKRSIVIDRDFHNPFSLAEILRDFELVISTRLHMAILALGVGTPVLPISYEFKTDELFNRIGQGKWIENIEQICSTSITERLDSFLESLPQIRRGIFKAVERERRHALETASILKDTFGARQKTRDSLRNVP